MNCLIVEDEPLAADVLKEYIEQIPGLILVAVCDNVIKAMEKLREYKIDVIFLDINLPKITGIEFLKTISGKYHIILTTAYHEYALDGFNLNVTDYLLKPIEFSRFLQAVNKVYEKSNLSNINGDAISRKFYFFNTDKKNIKIFADEIIYIESLKDYIKIHTTDKKVITKIQIGELGRFLDDERFIRIHKSFVVNSEKVKAFNAIQIEVEGATLPLGRTYKDWVEKKLKG